MRTLLVLLVLATPALALAAPTGAPPATAPAPTAPAPAAAQPHPTAPTPPPPDPDLVYYPAAARAAGIEGQAVLRCGRDTHLKLENCSLVSEAPAGQGFGAAAMSMAAANVGNPKITTTESDLVDPGNIVVRFVLHPPLIDPDISQPAHVNTSAALISAPTHEQLQGAYPVRALADQVDGVALLDCVLTKAAVLTSCKVLGERPDGYGFGQAALEVTKDFKLKARLLDGDAIDSEVHVPVQFTVADPDGPLMLKTVPPGTPPPR